MSEDGFKRLLLETILKNAMYGPPPQLAETEIDGLRFSTILAREGWYETAVCDSDACYPVEKYDTEEQALAGHWVWVERAPELTEVTKIAYGDLIEEKKVTLIR